MAKKKPGSAPTSGSRRGKVTSSGNSTSGVIRWCSFAVILVAIAGYYVVVRETPLPAGDGPIGEVLRLGQSAEHITLHVSSQRFPDTGQGLAAARTFKEGETVMELPTIDSAYLGFHNLPATYAAYGRAHLLKDAMGSKQRLVLAILFERQNPDSPFQPFFRALPQQVTNLAAMGHLHRRALNATPITIMFDNFDEIVEATFRYVQAAQTLFTSTPSKDDISWALAVIQSRAHMKGDDRILSPYASMANHNYDIEKTLQYVKVVGNPTKIEYRARAKIRKGEEVFMFYGMFSNLRLLVQYGFTIPGNPILDRLPISLFDIAGARLFRFGNELAPRGPLCKQISENREEELKRTRHQSGHLPKLFVNCWRVSRFENVTAAKKAVDAGMFRNDEQYLSAASSLPFSWLQRDAEVYDNISAGCAQVRDTYNSSALDELGTMDDFVSVQLRQTLLDEIETWNGCIAEMSRRAQQIREYAASAFK